LGAWLDWLAMGLAALAIVGGALTVVLMAANVSMVVLHLALRRRGLADEAARLANPLPRDADLPHVVVQVPVYNEGALVERAIASAAQLDWPQDKLHIQICDDSTDGSVDFARAAARRFAVSGIDVVVLHRADRSEFKAGALRAAMEQTKHDYFAIFDVDFIPPREFLRRCMAVLLGDGNLAFVQARPDFLNADENSLTRAQAIALDSHHAIEQATRSWAGYPLPFNGTCGIWRRAAIEAGGGWRGETLAEDLDLSYRACFLGWRGIFLTSVAVPGELPADRHALVVQQRRWIIGTGQVALKMLPVALRAPNLTLRQRLGALVHFGSWWSAPVSAAMSYAAVIAIIVDPAWIPFFATVLVAFMIAGNALMFTQYRLANRFLHGAATPVGAFARDFIAYVGLAAHVGWVNRDVVWVVTLGKKSVFERTAKIGRRSTSVPDRERPGKFARDLSALGAPGQDDGLY
jgi:cellulose synthase/poly-beta-1,6-N-acetylglucosamine synthase-like glycosyltransferase